jgi:hypothetical protein
MAQDYGTSAKAYLVRALRELRSEDVSRLFYAAFELHAGIEARLREYLENQDHVPDGRKKDWQVARLGASVAKAFSSNSVARVQIRRPGVDTITLLYTPVSSELQLIAKRLGDYLHAGEYRAPDDASWGTLRTTIEIGCHLLEDATAGTLLGPPLINTTTGHLHLPMELPPGREASDFATIGDKAELDIRYFDNLADARGDAA